MDDKVFKAVEAFDREMARWHIQEHRDGKASLIEVRIDDPAPTAETVAYRNFAHANRDEAMAHLKHIAMEAALRSVGALDRAQKP